MNLAQILFTQGFGTRRICAGLIQHGEVSIDGVVIDDPHHEVEPKGLIVRVSGKDWPYFEKALVLLNKPTGYECSQKPKHHPSVMALLPPPLREREVQPIGRLDEDTTGLLLFTDDGKLIHKLTSPKHHVPKVYEAQC
ncbi:MAG: rRNA pseudouridine synthase, partial [Burkholderiaceae bacterium]|nr:rRNA pseudouridine synthase [Burkholderiaceae bacterium]